MNNPTKFWDPDGEFFWFAVLAGAIIGGIAGMINAGVHGQDIGGIIGGFFLGALIGAAAGATAGGLSAAFFGAGTAATSVAGVTVTGMMNIGSVGLGGGLLSGMGAFGAALGTGIAGAASGFINSFGFGLQTGMYTGKEGGDLWGSALQAGGEGALGGFITGGFSSGFGSLGDGGRMLGSMFGQGFSRGTMTALRGGNFLEGFGKGLFSGTVGGMASFIPQGDSDWQVILSGGTQGAITGFADMALSGSFNAGEWIQSIMGGALNNWANFKDNEVKIRAQQRQMKALVRWRMNQAVEGYVEMMGDVNINLAQLSYNQLEMTTIGHQADWTNLYDNENSREKVMSAYSEFKKYYRDTAQLTYEQVKQFAESHGLNDPERLYLVQNIAHDNPNFNRSPDGYTHCDAYAGYVTYLYTGSTELRNPAFDGVIDNRYQTWSRTVYSQGRTSISGNLNSYRSIITSENYSTYDVSQGTRVQDLANQGKLVYAIYTNPDNPYESHIALVAPGEGVYRNITVGETTAKYYSPAIAQQGAQNLLAPGATMRTAFSEAMFLRLTYYTK